MAALFAQKTRLPFLFRWVGSRMIVTRDTEGGDDCGDPVIARLRFTEMPALLRAHSSTWDECFDDLGNGALPLGGGEWSLREDVIQNAIAPSAKRIACPVAALIGPTNASATFGFTSAARASGKVRLFGVTAGGNRRSLNRGAFLFAKLPYSGIAFDLPLKGYVGRGVQPDRGIDPDVQMTFAQAWIGAAKDPVIEAAAAWCAGRG